VAINIRWNWKHWAHEQ